LYQYAYNKASPEAESRFFSDMVQKGASLTRSQAETRRRGRPRAYDPDVALQQALETFWAQGYSRTSLDDLVGATGMNRPSLYAAFGDKRTLYLKALDHYWDGSLRLMRELLSTDRELADGLMRVYDAALSFYFPKEGRPRGCFAIGTATAEAVVEPQIREALDYGLRKVDEEFGRRMRYAQQSGELSETVDVNALIHIASAVLHTLALRVRSGATRTQLRNMAKRAVATICARNEARCSA
jgi:AcrR family transcriptional regulator